MKGAATEAQIASEKPGYRVNLHRGSEVLVLMNSTRESLQAFLFNKGIYTSFLPRKLGLDAISNLRDFFFLCVGSGLIQIPGDCQALFPSQ